ncbi:EAL domain-containing protein [candidate division WOR-3 bacterium]|nr:EAL domain-containing protein [candidate division WOR-3 bacterium]
MSDRSEEAKIRKEWLQFRGALYDYHVDFPTLPIVMDKVRKNIGNFKKIGLIYLDIIESVETIHGWQKFEEVLKRISIILKELYSNELRENDIIAMQAARAGKFIIFIFSQDDGKEVDKYFMQDLLDNIHKTIFEKTEDLRMKFLFPETICHIGMDFLYIDPVVRFERNLYSSVSRAHENAYSQTTNFWERRYRELKRIIVNNDIQTVFQPILKFSTGDTVGYEALTRITSIEFFNDTETLFSFAVQTEMILELERICRKHAIMKAKHALRGRKLFLNVSAKGVLDPEFIDGRFITDIEEIGLSVEDVVLEITERLAIRDIDLFKQNVKRLENSGFSVAIDDVGAGYSSLHTIAELSPTFLKYDMALIRDINRHAIKRNLLESLLPFSQKINSVIIAEGIETGDEFDVLKEIGIEYGQGFFFGKPGFLLKNQI